MPPKRQRKIGRWILFGSMMVVAVIMLYPFWIMIITSLKSESQFLSGGGFSWLSWSTLTSVIPIGQEVLSSTIVCSSSILIILCVGLPAGFAFSKLRFRMSTVVFLVIVSAMMVPLQAILMPEFVNVTKLGLTGVTSAQSSSTRRSGRRFPYSSSRLTFAACPMSSSKRASSTDSATSE